MERSTIFHGKTHYKLPFSIANCQPLPEGIPGKDMRRKGSGLCLIYGQKQCMLMIQEIGTFKNEPITGMESNGILMGF